MAHPTSAAMKLTDFLKKTGSRVTAAARRIPATVSTRRFPFISHALLAFFAGGKRIRPILCIENRQGIHSHIAAALHPG